RDLRQAADQGAVPGVVALAMHDSRVVYQGAFGHRALPDGPAMSMDTVFRIASMTKAVTGVAAMQMVERGKLSLEAPAGEIVPELKEPVVLEGFDESGTPRTRPARRQITLRHLLTHTAGFGYDIWNSDIARYCRVTGLPAPRTGLLAGLRAPLTSDPGERWQYSISIDWAGRMVEAVSGMDLETYFQKRIFAPLGREDTSYEVRPHMLPRLATAYARKDGSLQPLMIEPNPVREFFPGGGGLHSTAGDYMRFLRMLMNGGELDGFRVLQPQTVADMARNHIDDLLVEKMVSYNPASSNDVELFPGMNKKWGLSFLINTEAGPCGRSAGSLAWAGLYNSYYWLDPRARVAGVLLTQILPFGDPVVLELLNAFERGVYEQARL
ncbi:MAG: serine hydrolase domain-containing protein, partial [Solirubrobacteraceae bacterium]